MKNKKLILGIASIFIWIGLVCAISFLESWLKFRAPGITLSLGLGIGRLVFNALNTIEWVMAFIVLATLFNLRPGFTLTEIMLFLLPLFILCLQTFWLLPALDLRATARIENQPLPQSNLHFFFAGAEVIKVIFLTFFGISLFNKAICTEKS